jgi:hypothetical protein
MGRVFRLRKNQSGSIIIETAIILPIFLVLTFAIIEMSLILFYSFIVEGAMFQAVRSSKIAADRGAIVDFIRQEVRDQSFGLLPTNKLFITTDIAVNSAAKLAEIESCTDGNGAIIPDSFCPCNPNNFVDKNSDGQCNDGEADLELGDPGDIVEFITYYQHDILTPFLGSIIGNNGVYVIESGVFIRNELE